MGEEIRVLHVDDDLKFTQITAKLLEEENDALETVAETRVDGALERLHANGADIDCIVSDYALPDANGVEFLETVREENPHLPFILFTGKGSEEVASEALASGATDYLQKQKGTEQYSLLANRIRNAVEQDRRRQEREQGERYRKELYRITSDPTLSLEEKIADLLETGCEYLDVENGHVARIDRDTGRHEITLATGSDFVQSATTTDLEETYCEKTISEEGILTVYDAEAEGWQDEPAYERWGIGCYIGGKIEVGSDLYGTVCFVNRDAKARPFTEGERTFVDLVTRWLSQMFERAEREREFEALEEKYHRVVEQSRLGVCLVRGGELAYANERFAEILGTVPDDVTGRPPHEWVAERDRDRVTEAIRELEEGKADSFRLILSAEQADGAEIPVELSGGRVETDGRPAVLGTLQRVSEDG